MTVGLQTATRPIILSTQLVGQPVQCCLELMFCNVILAGEVGNQDNNAYKLYCYLQTYGNNFQVNALQPNEKNRYICEFQSEQ